MNVVHADFRGTDISFRQDGWFDATAAARRFNRRPTDWLNLPSTDEYIEALKAELSISEKSSLIQARRNSGTWFSPELAVPFARWLDVRFGVWCDQQIKALLSGKRTAVVR